MHLLIFQFRLPIQCLLIWFCYLASLSIIYTVWRVVT